MLIKYHPPKCSFLLVLLILSWTSSTRSESGIIFKRRPQTDKPIHVISSYSGVGFLQAAWVSYAQSLFGQKLQPKHFSNILASPHGQSIKWMVKRQVEIAVVNGNTFGRTDQIYWRKVSPNAEYIPKISAGTYATAVVVNSQTRINSLSMLDLGKIFHGTVHDWAS